MFRSGEFSPVRDRSQVLFGMNLEEATVPIGERIKEVRGPRSQQEFAEHLSVSLSSLRRYESGERFPDVEFLLTLQQREGVDPTWLLTGTPSTSNGAFAARQYGRLSEALMSGELQKIPVFVAGKQYWVDPNDYRWVPLLDVKVAAGVGAAPGAERVVGFNAYRKSWLAEHGLLEAELSEVTVAGQSMEPVLVDGKTVLVNHSITDPQGGGIFVVRQDDDLIAKYLQALPGGRLQVSSENSQAFKTYEVTEADIAAGSFAIIGAVVPR